MPVLKTDSDSIHYAESGRGDPVLLAHSGGYTSTQWRGVMDALQARFRLLAIDLQGCASTPLWSGARGMTLADEAELVRALARSAGRPVHLVGHSYGGAVALRSALNDPAPYASLTLLEPICFNLLRQAGETTAHTELLTELEAFVRTARAGDPATAMGRFVEYWNARPGMWASLAEEVRAELTARVPAMLHQCHALKYDDTKVGELSSIALPTALMEGEATIEPMRRLMAVVARHMPTAGRIALPRLRHMAPATHPQPVAEALGAWLTATS